jgi:hypothetical protein
MPVHEQLQEIASRCLSGDPRNTISVQAANSAPFDDIPTGVANTAVGTEMIASWSFTFYAVARDTTMDDNESKYGLAPYSMPLGCTPRILLNGKCVAAVLVDFTDRYFAFKIVIGDSNSTARINVSRINYEETSIKPLKLLIRLRWYHGQEQALDVLHVKGEGRQLDGGALLSCQIRRDPTTNVVHIFPTLTKTPSG